MPTDLDTHCVDRRFETVRQGGFFADGLKSSVLRRGEYDGQQSERWLAAWSNMTPAEAQDIRAVVETVGHHAAVSWTPPGESVPRAFVIAEGSYSEDARSANSFNIVMRLVAFPGVAAPP